jgi:hypothetical protein
MLFIIALPIDIFVLLYKQEKEGLFMHKHKTGDSAEIGTLPPGTRIGVNDTGGPHWKSRFGTDSIIDGVVARSPEGQYYVVPLNRKNLQILALAAGNESELRGRSLQKYLVSESDRVTVKG